jgi:hypothetical protein
VAGTNRPAGSGVTGLIGVAVLGGATTPLSPAQSPCRRGQKNCDCDWREKIQDAEESSEKEAATFGKDTVK